MIAYVKNLIRPWGVMHWIRLAIAIFLLVQGFVVSDHISVFLGSILGLQVFTNTGCCGSAGCNLPLPANTDTSADVKSQ